MKNHPVEYTSQWRCRRSGGAAEQVDQVYVDQRGDTRLRPSTRPLSASMGLFDKLLQIQAVRLPQAPLRHTGVDGNLAQQGGQRQRGFGDLRCAHRKMSADGPQVLRSQHRRGEAVDDPAVGETAQVGEHPLPSDLAERDQKRRQQPLGVLPATSLRPAADDRDDRDVGILPALR